MNKEQDPNGLKPTDPGAKLDAGKPMSAQILGQFPLALNEVAKVGTYGAEKYSIGGWKHVENGFNRYDDAGMRHFLKRKTGEEYDPDSKLLHLSHEAWNALAKLEMYLSGGNVEKDSPITVSVITGPMKMTGWCEAKEYCR